MLAFTLVVVFKLITQEVKQKMKISDWVKESKELEGKYVHGKFNNGDDFDGLLGGDHIKFVDVENNKLVIKDMWLDHKKSN